MLMVLRFEPGRFFRKGKVIKTQRWAVQSVLRTCIIPIPLWMEWLQNKHYFNGLKWHWIASRMNLNTEPVYSINLPKTWPALNLYTNMLHTHITSAVSIPLYIPLPPPLKVTCDLKSNWKKFKQLWDSHEINTNIVGDIRQD